MGLLRRHHKRRHRKKLRLGEFQEFGFGISAACPQGWDDARREQAVLALIDHAYAVGLAYSGGDSAAGIDGYLIRPGGSATDADREAIEARMRELGFEKVKVAALTDAWHGPIEGDLPPS